MVQKGKTIHLLKYIAILAFLFSCEEITKVEMLENEKDYYPVKIGLANTYQVNEITYFLNGTKKILNYQIKEKITNKVFQNSTDNSETYSIEKYKRNDSLSKWVLDSIGTVEVYRNRVVKVFNNLALQKIVFPIKSSSEWDINKYNIEAKDYNESYFTDINQPVIVNNKKYDHAIKVIHGDKKSNIDKYLYTETFVLNIGMVSSEKKIYSYCQEDFCIRMCEKGTCTIDNGYEIAYELLESSIE